MQSDDDFYRIMGIDNDPRFEMLRSWEIKENRRKIQRLKTNLKYLAITLLCFAVIILAVYLRA